MLSPQDSYYCEERSAEAQKLRREISRTNKRQRVSAVLNSGTFRTRLEDIVQRGPGRRRRSHTSLQDVDVDNSDEDDLSTSSSPNRQAIQQMSFQDVVPVNDLNDNSSQFFSDRELELRRKLATLYRIIDTCGWNNYLYDCATVCTGSKNDEILIKPYGLPWREMTASSLIKLSSKGFIINRGMTSLGYNKHDYALHAAVRLARPEVQCVIHMHTAAGVAVSAMACGLLSLSQEAMMLGKVSYHRCCSSLMDEKERRQISADLGPESMVMILHNHGLVAVGRTVEEAFHYMNTLAKACEIQVKALAAGLSSSALILADETAQQHAIVMGGAEGFNGYPWSVGELEFELFVRELEDKGCDTGLELKTDFLATGELQADIDISSPEESNSGPLESWQSKLLHDRAGLVQEVKQNGPRVTAGTQLPSYQQSPDFDMTTAGHSGPQIPSHGINRLESDHRHAGNTSSLPQKAIHQAVGRPKSITEVDDPTLSHHRQSVAQSTERAMEALKVFMASPSPSSGQITSSASSLDPAPTAAPRAGSVTYHEHRPASGLERDDVFEEQVPLTYTHSGGINDNEGSFSHMQPPLTEEDLRPSYPETLRKTKKLAKTVAKSTRTSASSLLSGHSPAQAFKTTGEQLLKLT